MRGILLAITVGALALAACGGGSPQPTPIPASPTPDANATATRIALLRATAQQLASQPDRIDAVPFTTILSDMNADCSKINGENAYRVAGDATWPTKYADLSELVQLFCQKQYSQAEYSSALGVIRNSIVPKWIALSDETAIDVRAEIAAKLDPSR